VRTLWRLKYVLLTLSLRSNAVSECANYLKEAVLHVCLPLNFGNPRLKVKRTVIGPQTILNHLRVQRQSAFIRV
jgi:hypothetical protein